MTVLGHTSINVIDLRHLVPHPIAYLSTVPVYVCGRQ